MILDFLLLILTGLTVHQNYQTGKTMQFLKNTFALQKVENKTMQANMETVQYLTEQIRVLTVETANLTIRLQRIQSDRIWNGRSTIHQEQELLRRIHQTGREVHSLKTKRGMLLKVMRDNQLSIIGE